MDIKILGPGCKNCQNLETRTREALAAIDSDATITKVTDVTEIAGFGVMRTPALVVGDEVVVSGRVPTARELRDILEPRSR